MLNQRRKDGRWLFDCCIDSTRVVASSQYCFCTVPDVDLQAVPPQLFKLLRNAYERLVHMCPYTRALPQKGGAKTGLKAEFCNGHCMDMFEPCFMSVCCVLRLS